MVQPTRRKKISEKLRRWLLLLFSPLIIALIASVLVALGTKQSIECWMWWMCGILALSWILLYVAAYTNYFQRPFEFVATFRRLRRFRKPRVLVLDGRLEDDQPANVPAYSTDRRPDDWRTLLKTENPRWHVKLGPISHLLEEQFDIVLNPFGEAYPEENLALHTTLKKLTDWVHGGGVYVNVAGYPFFWQHNPTTGVTTQSGRWELNFNKDNLLEKGQLKPILSDTLLGISPDMTTGVRTIATQQDELERKRFGELAGAEGGNEVSMFRAYPCSTQRMIPMLRTTDSKHIVIGAISYGLGFFIFCGVKIDAETTAFEKVAAAIKGWARYETMGRKT